MINLCRWTLLPLMLLTLFAPVYAHATEKGLLHLLFVDVENLSSIERYLSEEKRGLNRHDMFVFFDAQTSEPIIEYRKLEPSVKIELKKSMDLMVLKDIDDYDAYKSGEYDYDTRVRIKQLNRYDRDVARMIETAQDYIRIYGRNYKEIRVIFFGDSILHDAYGHNFAKGVPSDGFINLDESEFNSFPDIKSKKVSVRIFFDEEPMFSKPLLRFYDKLIRKKLGVSISAYNSNAAMNSVPISEENSKPFHADVVRIIGENIDSECGEADKILPLDYDLDTASVNVELVNKCRANTMITFELVHSNEKQLGNVDANGRVEASFRLSVGENEIRYKLLSGKWHDILKTNIEPRSDALTYALDESTNTVKISGSNPFRLDGDYVDIEYKRTGAHYRLKVDKKGQFHKVVPVLPGSNIFSVTQMNGKDIKEHNVEYSTKCSDVVEPDLARAREYGILWVNLKNSCRADGSIVKFFYDHQEYSAVVQDGSAGRSIVLNQEINDVFYEDFNKNNSKLASIKIRDFADLIRFGITYKDNVIVLSNIYETNIPSSDPHATIDYLKKSSFRDGILHVNNPRSKKGEFLIRNQFSDFRDYLKEDISRTYEQFYVSRQSSQGAGEMYFFVDYFSRHGSFTDDVTGKKEKPLCGARSRGGVVIEYNILFAGSTEIGKKFLDPARCENGNPTIADKQLILIKKVSIK